MLVASAQAQTASEYSSKWPFIRGHEGSLGPLTTVRGAVSATSSKPWLLGQSGTVNERVVTAVASSVAPGTVNTANYNSKMSSRGERPISFELAPLK